MSKIISPLAVAPFAALIALAACSESEPEIVGGMADPDAEEIEELAPAELPPMRTREASFRCADNSIVYVSFYTNDSQVGVSMERDAVQTLLPNVALAAAEEAGEEAAEAPAGPPRYSAEGFTLVGVSDAPSIQFARNGGGLQRCNS